MVVPLERQKNITEVRRQVRNTAGVDIVDLAFEGAQANNLTDISGVANSVIASLSALPQGGEIFLPDGQYALAAPIILLPKVNLRFSPNAIITATASMDAMLKSGVGASARLRRQSVLGGFWKANKLAERCLWMRDFQQLKISGANFESCDGKYLDFGDPAVSANCYELILSGLLLNRNASGARPSGNIGLNFLSISDSHIDQVVGIGAETGLYGTLYGSQVSKVHFWGFSGGAGNPDVGFYVTGADNHFLHCQVDNPLTYGYRFSGARSYLTNSRILVDADAQAPDNTIYAVRVDNSAVVVAMGNLWTSDVPEKRIAGEFTGTTNNVQAGDNTSVRVVTPFRNTFTLTQHDASVLGGNAPGIGAVDFVTLRDAVAQVASGQAAGSGGEFGTAAGQCSFQWGQYNSVSGLCAVALGYDNVVTASHAQARGRSARAYSRTLSDTWGGGTFADNTRLQVVRQLLQNTTTNNTPTRLTANGGAISLGNSLHMQPKTTITIPRLRVVAVDNAGNRAEWGVDDVIISQGATLASTVLDSPAAGNLPLIRSVGSVTGWSTSLGVDTATGSIAINGTGATGVTLHWSAWIDGLEMQWPV